MSATTTAPIRSKNSPQASWRAIMVAMLLASILMFVGYDNNRVFVLLVNQDRELRGKPDAERLEMMEAQREELKDRAHTRRLIANSVAALLMGLSAAVLIVQLTRFKKVALR